MDFFLGAPLAMLAFLLAPILARRWITLGVMAAIGLAIPAAVVAAHGGFGAIAFQGGSDPSAQILAAYCALFLVLFAFPLAARAVGLALQTRGWTRWRLLPLDLFALAPAIGFYGTLFFSALQT